MVDQWAYGRVRELVDAQTKQGWSDEHTPSGVAHAFARYIAEHEEPPVDPLLVEARELAAVSCSKADSGSRYLAGIRAGEHDDAERSGVPLALAALRRGIEIAKGGES